MSGRNQFDELGAPAYIDKSTRGGCIWRQPGDLVMEYVVFYFGSTAPRIGIRGSPSRDIEEKSKNHPDSSGSEFRISNFAFAMIGTQLFSPTG